MYHCGCPMNNPDGSGNSPAALNERFHYNSLLVSFWMFHAVIGNFRLFVTGQSILTLYLCGLLTWDVITDWVSLSIKKMCNFFNLQLKHSYNYWCVTESMLLHKAIYYVCLCDRKFNISVRNNAIGIFMSINMQY